MINPYAIGAAVLACVILFGAGYYQGTVSEMERQAQAWKQNVADVREQERTRQKQLNVIIQEQADEQRTINARLADELERVRQRANRLSRDATVNCSGATGRELSAADAAFLARLAARADELRAGLAACYEYVDSMN